MVHLHGLESPRLYIIVASKKAFGDYAYKTSFDERSLALRLVRGTKMHNRNDLFDEFSAAFQFPLYFGENWDALEECLADLEWVPASGYGLFVTDTAQVLSREHADQFDILLKVLSNICEEWSAVETPRPFHVLFQCTPEDLDHLEQRFLQVGVDVAIERL